MSNWRQLPYGSKNPATGRVIRSQKAWTDGTRVEYFESDPNKKKTPKENTGQKNPKKRLNEEIKKMDSMSPEDLTEKAKELGTPETQDIIDLELEDKKEEYKKLGTKAPAFKAWFGDWEHDQANASKAVDDKGEPLKTVSQVVDEDGLPKEVYHGTHGKFDEFKMSDEVGGKFFGEGFYFTDAEDYAEHFASVGFGEGEGSVMKLYLSIKNPFLITDNREYRNTIREFGNADSYNKHLREQGYDGLKIDRFEPAVGHEVTEWVVFEPNQIKSVDNVGTFDPNNPKISLSSNWQRLPVGSKNPRTGRVIRSSNAWYNPTSQQTEYFSGDPNKGGKQSKEQQPQDRSQKVENPQEKLANKVKEFSQMNSQELEAALKEIGADPKLMADEAKGALISAMKDVVKNSQMSTEEKYEWAKRETKALAKWLGVDKNELRNELNATLKAEGVKIKKEMPKEQVQQTKEAGKKAFDNSENENYEKQKALMARESANISKGAPSNEEGLPEEFKSAAKEAREAVGKESVPEQKQRTVPNSSGYKKKEPIAENPNEGFSTEPPKSPEEAANEAVAKHKSEKETASKIASGHLPTPEQSANAAVADKKETEKKTEPKKEKTKTRTKNDIERDIDSVNNEITKHKDSSKKNKTKVNSEKAKELEEKKKSLLEESQGKKPKETDLTESEIKQTKEILSEPKKSPNAPKDYKEDYSHSGNKSIVLEPRGKDESEEEFAIRKAKYIEQIKNAFEKSFAEHKASGMSDEDARYEAALDNRIPAGILKEISPSVGKDNAKKPKSAPTLSESEIKRYKEEFGVDATGKTLEEANQEVIKKMGLEDSEEKEPKKSQKPKKSEKIAKEDLPKSTSESKLEETKPNGGEEVEKPYSEESESKYPSVKFMNRAATSGSFTFHKPQGEDSGALKHDGNTYPTLKTKDGKVSIALDTSYIYEHNNSVFMSRRDNDDKEITLAAITTDPESRGKGLASKALSEFEKVADEEGFSILLEPAKMEKFSKRGQKSLTTQQLKKWYKKRGYVPVREGSDRILRRSPKAK